jgi:RNA polymerase sigma-70 factor (ECF subfamily)
MKGYGAVSKSLSLKRLRAEPRGSGLTRAEERRLVSAARSGDARAMRQLLTLVSGPAYRFGRGFCGNQHDAEDVTQVVLSALVRSLSTFRGDASLTTWAYTVARHACSRQRRHALDAPARFESLNAARHGPPLDLHAAGADPHAHLERGEMRRALEDAIARLPASQRDVLILRDVEGRSAREVAGALRIGEPAVKSRLHRARASLRHRLAPLVGDDEASPPALRPPRGCPDVPGLLSRYLEGEVDGKVCERLERHVARCVSCRRACDQLRRALGACRAWGRARLPSEVRSAVREAIQGALRDARPIGSRPPSARP